MDLSLIETLGWEPGTGFVRLERHLARLARSAEALGLEGADRARGALDSSVAGKDCPQRVRLELFGRNEIAVTTAPFVPLPAGAVWTVAIARTRLSSGDLLLRHKTSRRGAYEAARAEFPLAEVSEVLLLNEQGDICEGTITSLFLDDGSGILKTPPLACGLLAGVLREELLETGRAAEAPLRPDDLKRSPFYLGNSLRGLIPGRLIS